MVVPTGFPPLTPLLLPLPFSAFFNTSGHSVQFVTERLGYSGMGYDAVLAELDCADSTSDELDSSVKTVVDGVCQQGGVMVALCSPNKSILYMALKPKLATKTDAPR